MFIACLVIAVCSSSSLPSANSNKDPLLLQLSSNPQSEAIFASIATVLSSSHSSQEGFDRVIAILSEMVQSTRSQNFQNNLNWRETQQSCEVSKFNFHERQEFFDGVLSSLNQGILEANAETAEAKDVLSSRRKALEAYNKVNKSEKVVHADESQQLEASRSDVNEGINAIDSAAKAVENWTVQSQNSSVLDKLKKVTYHYSRVIKFKVDMSEKFLSKALHDERIRERILNWLGGIKIEFISLKGDMENILARRKALAQQIETSLSDLSNEISEDINSFSKVIRDYKEDVKLLQSSLDRFSLLSSKNKDIMNANNNYCSSEEEGYNRLSLGFKHSIDLYSNIRIYFKENYNTIREFLKNKYRSIH